MLKPGRLSMSYKEPNTTNLQGSERVSCMGTQHLLIWRGFAHLPLRHFGLQALLTGFCVRQEISSYSSSSPCTFLNARTSAPF